MSLKIALLCDPVATLNPRQDSTLLLALEAQTRGHRIWHLTPADICLEDGRVMGWASALAVSADPDNYYTQGPAQRHDLNSFDLVLLRQNPPFDDAFLTLTYLLEKLDIPVFNDPASIRNFPGKLFPLEFPDYIVPYVISRRREDIALFLDRQEEIILKPLFDYGGRGVSRIRKGESYDAVFESFVTKYPSPFVLQKFIPEATKGDKRIILFDGEPQAAILRVPAKDGFLGNISSGASIQPTELTVREKELCKKLGPRLRELGLFFTGLDMLGDYITEINVISTGTLRAANALYDMRLEKNFWDLLEKRLSSKHPLEIKTAKH